MINKLAGARAARLRAASGLCTQRRWRAHGSGSLPCARKAGSSFGDVSHMTKAHNTRSCAGGGSAHAGAHSKPSAVRPQNPAFGTCAAQCVHARLAAAHLAYSLSRVCCTCKSVQEVQSAPGQQPGRASGCDRAHTHALRGAASRQSALSTRKMSPRADSMVIVTPRGRGAAGAGAAAAHSVRWQEGTSVLRVRSAPGRWRRRNTSAQVQTARGVGWARRRSAGGGAQARSHGLHRARALAVLQPRRGCAVADAGRCAEVLALLAV
jgi:hypothetical protein